MMTYTNHNDRGIQEKIQNIFPEKGAIPENVLFNIPIHGDHYLIGGELKKWHGPMQDVFSPVHVKNGETLEPKFIGTYPLLTEKEALSVLDVAVNAYRQGTGEWPTMQVGDRIKHIQQFAFRMAERRESIVNLLMWEIGKSRADSEKEFDRTIVYINDTVSSLKDLDRASSRFMIEEGIIGQTRRAPLGVVLCMGPFNYPLNETFATLIPALIMGNVVIFKPPKHGALLYHPLVEAFCGCFPEGVVNMVYGSGSQIIPPMMVSGKINVLALIGTSKVANPLRRQHPKPNRLRCVLGLEAKNAAVILPDADLDTAVRECVLGALSFNGQRCTALKILFVHKDIADVFLSHLSAQVSKLHTGMPWEKEVVITPLPESGKTDYLASLVSDAVSLGAKVINPEGGIRNNSFFYPAVLYPVNKQMRVYTEEQFGPVIPVVPFDDIKTPTDYIIDSNYGQQVSIFGSQPETLSYLIDHLVNQVARVNVNCQCQRGPDSFPFTGRKDSAEGTLSVADALRAFSIRTMVASKETGQNKTIITQIVKERKSKFLSTDFIL